MSTTIVTAKVKYAAGEPKDLGYGPSINVLFEGPEAKAIRVYGKPNDEALKALQKGQEVQLLEQDGKYKLITPEPGSTPATTAASQVPAGPKPAFQHFDFNTQEVHDLTGELVGLYKEIYNLFKSGNPLDDLDLPIDEHAVISATGTVFIEISKIIRGYKY